MRINKASEAVLAKYAPKEKLRVQPLYKTTSVNSKSSSLQDFYQEVNAKYNASMEQVFLGKNAQEIETIMVQNRRLIETKRNLQR
ncbi:MAG TPA: hypothetical protein VJA83_02870 [Sulfuricurvum sp.]|nr:hypothetical protein [Sulfuricurvum sp.]